MYLYQYFVVVTLLLTVMILVIAMNIVESRIITVVYLYWLVVVSMFKFSILGIIIPID